MILWSDGKHRIWRAGRELVVETHATNSLGEPVWERDRILFEGDPRNAIHGNYWGSVPNPRKDGYPESPYALDMLDPPDLGGKPWKSSKGGSS